MNLPDFLNTVVTTSEGFFCLSASDGKVWKEHWFNWPAQRDEIVTQAEKLRRDFNVYFTAHLFRAPASTKANVLPSRTIQADLDYADIYALPISPTVLIETSPKRYQAYWVITTDNIEPSDLEELSCRLTYSIDNSDRTGWPLGHRLRLPFTYNYKYDPASDVNIVSFATRRVDIDAFDAIPVVEAERANLDSEWVDLPHTEPADMPPVRTVSNLHNEKKISTSAYNQYTNAAKDRSEALWKFMCECFKANLGRDTVYWLSYNNANNKFLDRVHGCRDLRKDVLRAENNVSSKTLNIKTALAAIKNNNMLGTMTERRLLMYELLIAYMQQKGNFFHSVDGTKWYVPRDTGRPIYVSRHSDWFGILMTAAYGINSAADDYSYIVAEIVAFISSLPPTTQVRNLSYYDLLTNSLIVHTGGKELIVVSTNKVEYVSNGNIDVLFQQSPNVETFKVSHGELGRPWYEFMFEGCFDTIQNLSPAQAQAIAVVWFMNILFRNNLYTRPILAVLGQPGSGKSTMMRIVYRLLYGQRRALAKLRGVHEYDLSTTINAFVCYDNVDSKDSWLPDALAQSTSDTEVEVRKLYTDQDLIRMTRQAVVSVTAHAPKFIREDIADRLVMFNMRRRENFGDETDILTRITKHRAAIWGGVLRDVQKILASPKPDPLSTPQFRIKDFSTFGVWVSRALGFEKDFVSAIGALRSSQRELVLEEEYLLVTTLAKVAAGAHSDNYHSGSYIWQQCLSITNDPGSFQRNYRNASQLSKKLWVMMEALKEHFDIDAKHDTHTGVRLFRIKEKNDGGE